MQEQEREQFNGLDVKAILQNPEAFKRLKEVAGVMHDADELRKLREKSTYKVEKNVQLPAKKDERLKGVRSKIRLAIDSLEVGDSFLLKEKIEMYKASNARSAAQKVSARKYTIRKMSPRSWRIWRIE